MFSGIVEAQGTLAEVKTMGEGYRLRIETPLAPALRAGESLAVNGVCLTLTLADHAEAHADIGPETARVTTLGLLERGHAVNLERPVRVDGRFGGHFVLGHVDGVGLVEEVRSAAEGHWLTVSFPPALAPYFIHRGSVAVDGVSLTVAGLGDARFDVQIIPYTWAATTLRRLRAGDRVNLECDMIGKYILRALETAARPRT
jgi:riboflavin synthase